MSTITPNLAVPCFEIQPEQALFDLQLFQEVQRNVAGIFADANGIADICEREAAVRSLQQNHEILLGSLDTPHAQATVNLLFNVAGPPRELANQAQVVAAQNQVAQIVMTDFERFAAIATDTESPFAGKVMRLIYFSAERHPLSQNGEERSAQVDFLIDNFAASLDCPGQELPILERLLEWELFEQCDEAQQQRAVDMLFALIDEPRTHYVGLFLLKSAIRYIGHDLGPKDVFTSALMARYGLDFERMGRAWENGHNSDEFRNYEFENLETIVALETKYKGACVALTERFHIRNYARIPLCVLEHMYENINNKDLEYGVLVYGEDDSVLSTFYCNKDALEDFYRKLQSKEVNCGIRVYEAADVSEAMTAITDAEEVYDRQLAFCIVNAHGAETAITFGSSSSGQSCPELITQALHNAARFRQEDVGRLARQFTDLTELHLSSCSTGKGQDCVGINVARLLEVVVIAPEADMGIYGYEVERTEEGAVKVRINYEDNSKVRQFDGRNGLLGLLRHLGFAVL